MRGQSFKVLYCMHCVNETCLEPRLFKDVPGMVSQPRRTTLPQQAHAKSLGSGTLLFLVALCESVALSPYSSTGFTPQCILTNL